MATDRRSDSAPTAPPPPDALGELARLLKGSLLAGTPNPEVIQLIRETRSGYSPSHLEKLFRVPPGRVRRWIEKGLLDGV